MLAVSTVFQPKRKKNNATFIPRNPAFGPSQINHILVSSRWVSSVNDCKVSWSISCLRWGRRFDHGLVCMTLTTRIKMGTKVSPVYNYSLMKTDATMQTIID